jgi:hypothetical protein
VLILDNVQDSFVLGNVSDVIHQYALAYLVIAADEGLNFLIASEIALCTRIQSLVLG